MDVRWQRRERLFHQASIGRAGESTKLEWVVDSDYRFYPAQRDPDFGYVLHPADLATNKIMAAAGRRECRPPGSQAGPLALRAGDRACHARSLRRVVAAYSARTACAPHFRSKACTAGKPISSFISPNPSSGAGPPVPIPAVRSWPYACLRAPAAARKPVPG